MSRCVQLSAFLLHFKTSQSAHLLLICFKVVIQAISVQKDVDGLHPLNLAALATTQTHKNTTGLAGAGTVGHDPCWDSTSAGGGARGFSIACTPLACVELLDRSGVELSGASVAVVGRSTMVGVPLAMLLMQRDATVTMVHSKTKDPAAVCAQADIVVVAVGRPELVGADWVKDGAVVIDVGINSVEIEPSLVSKKKIPKPPKQSLFESTRKPAPGIMKTTKLVGDVKFAEVHSKCSAITPVPGGVGPMTIAMLLRNTLKAARRAALARADRVPWHQSLIEQAALGAAERPLPQVKSALGENSEGR
jgi:5,10-methylene-tetrahydrofolate dehydrogenase/methenyl tetrahydrofolate cyclohydrolase